MHGAHVARTKWSEVKSKVVNLKLFILFLYRTTVFIQHTFSASFIPVLFRPLSLLSISYYYKLSVYVLKAKK